MYWSLSNGLIIRKFLSLEDEIGRMELNLKRLEDEVKSARWKIGMETYNYYEYSKRELFEYLIKRHFLFYFVILETQMNDNYTDLVEKLHDLRNESRGIEK